jgi:ribosomal protein S18 acetylase RimI-like enzyme
MWIDDLRGSMLRNYEPADAEALGKVALEAFEQFRLAYSDWPALASFVSNMSILSETGEIIVAEEQQEIVGGVAYIGPRQPKADYFDINWPIIRMLVVKPTARGKGLGHLLTEECINRARRDKSPIIGLHTTPIMTVALAMYLRMGFTKLHHTPDIYGVPYTVYTKSLS